jgi:mono/diheme cytochrome c family protein
MSRSKFWSIVVVPAFVLLAGVYPPAAQAQHPEPAKGSAKPEAAADDKVARGRYIVEDVAMCGRCHSPVDMHGNRDTTHWLQGGAVGISPTVATDNWAIVAPRIGGAPPGTDEQFVHLLMTGESRRGLHLRQPMPQFRMSQADAEAVLAYLKSLGTHTPHSTN